MTILKEDNGKTPLIRSVGMREYAHFEQPFGLALGPVIDDEQRDRPGGRADAIACAGRGGVAGAEPERRRLASDPPRRLHLADGEIATPREARRYANVGREARHMCSMIWAVRPVSSDSRSIAPSRRTTRPGWARIGGRHRLPPSAPASERPLWACAGAYTRRITPRKPGVGTTISLRAALTYSDNERSEHR